MNIHVRTIKGVLVQILCSKKDFFTCAANMSKRHKFAVSVVIFSHICNSAIYQYVLLDVFLSTFLLFPAH